MKAVRNPRVALAAAALATWLALAATGSQAAADGVYEVELSDGEIALEAAEVPVGERVVETTNAGTREHELVVVRTNRAPAELPVGLHGVSISLAGELVVGEDHVAMGHAHAPGEVLGLLPGETSRAQVALRPGPYVAFCQTPGHYLAGEHAGFAVR